MTADKDLRGIIFNIQRNSNSDGVCRSEAVKDEVYYHHSGGGVTFGGDPVLQTDFLRELLIACGERGLHVAIDTAGNYPWKIT